MTADDLQALLEANDAEGCIRLFENATEAQRRALAKVAAARLRAVSAGVEARFMGLFESMDEGESHGLFPEAMPQRGGLRSARIAVLATATIGQLKKFGARCHPPIDDALAVLSARRPPWVGEWGEEVLSWDEPRGLGESWRYIRRLIRAGLCSRLGGPLYIHGMINASWSNDPKRGIREFLLEDPDLLDHEIWEIFETEPLPRMLDLLHVSPPEHAARGWEGTLAGLADEGRISRPRLLDASLGALERGFHELRARWFVAMHEALRPTPDERAGRIGRYLGLLTSHSPLTVKFAVEALAAAEKADRLDAAALVAGIGPALLARTKGTVLSALKLVDRAAAREPAIRSRAALAAVDAMAHESPAVQEAVADIVERHGDRADRALAQELRTRLDLVAASQRARLEAWLGVDAEAEDPGAARADLDALLARAGALDPAIAERAGVTAAVEALRRGGDVPAFELSEMAAPRLDPDRAVAPVADLDELIGLFSAVVEDPPNPDEVERLLDGVSRLCNVVPDDLAARTRPLLARAGRIEHMFNPLALPLYGLALGWIAGRPDDISYANYSGYLVGVFSRRVAAIARRAAERQAAPLLSAPTHLGGWIDPRILVERARIVASLPFRSDRMDGAHSLLRLAPDPGARAEALRSAADLEGPYAEALRYALGGDAEAAGPDARLWVAAARARAPRDDDPRVEARHPDLGPDAGQAARFSLRPGPHRASTWYERNHRTLVERIPPLPAGHPWDLPTVLLHGGRSPSSGDFGWAATIWPLGRESFHAAGVDWLVGHESDAYEARSYRPFLETLLDPDGPLGPMGRLLLAGGLSAKSAELQGLAVDALIAAVDDGRIDGRLLGEALHRLLAEGLVKPTRLVQALGGVARISPLHAPVVATALQITLVGYIHTRDLHLLLELLKELLIATGEPLSNPDAEAHIRSLKVAGKTGRLAGDLLGLTGGPDASPRPSAAARALAGRLERAERWARIAASTS